MISKRTLWLSIIVSMIVGIFAGYGIDRYYFVDRDSHFGKQRFITYMTERLRLSTYQQKQLDSIVTCVHPKFQSMRKAFKTQITQEIDSTQTMIKSILNSSQKRKYQLLIEKMLHGSDNR